VINLPNLMFIGIASALREALRVPILVTLGGEDVFLDRLAEPFRGEAQALIARHAIDVDAYIALTEYYAGHCETHFGLPRERMQVVPLGIATDDAARDAEPPTPPFNVGCVARICRDKGFDVLCRAYISLRHRGRDCRLITGGYLGEEHAPLVDQMRNEIDAAGFGPGFEYRGELSRQAKLALLRELHVFSMPSAFPEAKGIPMLEAIAAGVPVVQPRSGSFPELLRQTGGGILYDGDGPDALADAIESLIDDASLRRSLATAGSAAVREKFDHHLMADRAWALYERIASKGL
jgi:glycosyltransferase involved in cell wall biosynthesis